MQEKVSRNLKNWLKKENSEYRKIICSFFEAQDRDGRVLKGKMHEYCEKNECTHFVTYFSQLTNSTIQQGKIFEENKYGYVNLADDVKDMIVDFYKNVSNNNANNSAKNVNDLAEQSENVYSNSSDEMTKSKAIALLAQTWDKFRLVDLTQIAPPSLPEHEEIVVLSTKRKPQLST